MEPPPMLRVGVVGDMATTPARDTRPPSLAISVCKNFRFSCTVKESGFMA